MAKKKKLDQEIEEFRTAMEPPGTFEDGFNWTSFLGVLFVALLMVPGSMYMGLVAGQGIGNAARWVTVILFIEMARRAHRSLRNAEVFVLFFMAGAAMQAPFGGLLWMQFFRQSDAAMAYGIAEMLPEWVVPPAGSSSYAERTFFHRHWIVPIGMIIFTQLTGEFERMVLGYGFFRMASDVEKLPFPMAPVGAQGMMALAEDRGKAGEKEGWRWRVFAIGGALGLVFGFLYLGLPTIGNAFAGRPVTIFPIPFSDWTEKTQRFLPAVATGFNWNLLNIIMGMVMPFFAVLGSFIGLIITFIANPLLYRAEILSTWKPGDNTMATIFHNNVDFYFSLQIGIAVAIAVAGFIAVIKSVGKSREKMKQEKGMRKITAAPPGRGDIRTWFIILTYVVLTSIYIGVGGYLVGWHTGVMIVLLFFGFIYSPLISYTNARLEGLVGKAVEIPMIKEAALILSGYQGMAVWFIPFPKQNFGDDETVFYRKCELTGTSFKSIWKTKIFLIPFIYISSIIFSQFIWSMAKVPSQYFPYAQKMWELQAANKCIMYSATQGGYTLFEKAFDPTYMSCGLGLGLLLFWGLTALGTPTFFVYGVVSGLNQTLPHVVLPRFLGALLARYYFRKRFGVKKWRQYAPVLMAGFSCGMGLIATFGIGLNFLSKSAIQLPF
jgi:hypothetical protein